MTILSQQPPSVSDLAVSRIQAAFAETPSPGGNITSVSEKIPIEWDLERQAITKYFSGKRWQDITIARMHAEYRGDSSACMTFMTPEAFRYFVPSFMLMSLESFIESDVLVYSLIGRLTPRDAIPGLRVGFADDIGSESDRFSFEERQAIASFLLAMQEVYRKQFLDADTPAIALNLYWSRYLSDSDKLRVDALSRDEIRTRIQHRDKVVAELRRKYGSLQPPD